MNEPHANRRLTFTQTPPVQPPPPPRSPPTNPDSAPVRQLLPQVPLYYTPPLLESPMEAPAQPLGPAPMPAGPRCLCALAPWCPRHDQPRPPRNSTWCPLGDIFLPSSIPYGGQRVEYVLDPSVGGRIRGSGHHDEYGYAHVCNGLAETGLTGEPLAVVSDLRHAVLPGPDEHRDLLINAVSRALAWMQQSSRSVPPPPDRPLMCARCGLLFNAAGSAYRGYRPLCVSCRAQPDPFRFRSAPPRYRPAPSDIVQTHEAGN